MGDKRDVRDATQDCLEGLPSPELFYEMTASSASFQRCFQFFRGLRFSEGGKPDFVDSLSGSTNVWKILQIKLERTLAT